MSSGSTLGNRNSIYIGCVTAPLVWIGLFFLYFILYWIFPNYKESFVWIKDIAILTGLLIGGYIFTKKILFTSNSKNAVKTNERITHLIVNEDGIGLNLYNSLNEKVMPFYLWNDIKSIHLDFTRDLKSIFAKHRYRYTREDYLALLNQKYPNNEPFLSKDVYFDRFTLIINEQYNVQLKVAYIQIPLLWNKDGQWNDLLRTIDYYSPVKIEVKHTENEPTMILQEVL